MDIKEAMKIFGITSLDNINNDNIKKKWRQLMKQSHPDVGGSSNAFVRYNEAYDIIKKCSIRLAEFKLTAGQGNEDIYIMTLNELLSVYEGKSCTVTHLTDSTKSVKVDKETIGGKRIIIEVPVKVTINSLVYTYNCIAMRNMRDDYELELQITGIGMSQEVFMKVKVCNKEIEVNTKYNTMRFVFKLDHNIKISLQVERVESHGKNDDEGINS